MSNDAWNDNNIQFARLLAELQGVIPRETLEAVAVSMDLTPAQVGELLDRAVTAWEDIKSDRRWEEMDRLQAELDADYDPNVPNHIMLEDVVTKYGPVRRIDRTRADELCRDGKAGQVLCIHRSSEDVLYGSIGFHVVNVDERYELAKPASTDLIIYGCADVQMDEVCIEG